MDAVRAHLLSVVPHDKIVRYFNKLAGRFGGVFGQSAEGSQAFFLAHGQSIRQTDGRLEAAWIHQKVALARPEGVATDCDFDRAKIHELSDQN